ncbi:MAG: energy transducer TonB [Gemmatimonadales bacterium]|nr:energy transducer TonB [Gemmatimonadales bacterium]
MRLLFPFLAAVAVAGCARQQPSTAVAMQPSTSVAMRPTCGSAGSERPCSFMVALAWDSMPPVPRFPPALFSAGIRGEVRVRFGVDSSGRVDSATIVVQSSTNRAWIEPVTKAVARWSVAVPDTRAARAPWQQEVTVRFQADAPDCPVNVPAKLPIASWSVTPDPVLTIAGCPARISRDRLRPAPVRP